MRPRITDIEVITLRFEYPKSEGFSYTGGIATGRLSSLVRVSTDDGRVGWGSSYSHPDLVRLIIEHHLRPHLISRDATDVESLWDTMYGFTRWYGRMGVAVSAIGGIDTALWDLRAQRADKPLYEMLGGTEGTVPAYGSALLWSSPAQLASDAQAMLGDGFRRVKMRLGRGPEADVAALEAVVAVAGSDGAVIVDGSHRYSPESARAIAAALERCGVFWFEEPFPPEQVDAYADLRHHTSVPIAAGENECGSRGFRELIAAAAIDIAQPDASRAGGITECLRIGAMASAAGVSVAPHTWSDAVAVIANAHVVAALPNALTVEIDRTGNALIDDLLATPLEVDSGYLKLPDGPGLGVAVDELALERYALREPPVPDGNYSDLVFGHAFFSEPEPYG